jgi:formamidopyrimidine-DNA glycosylase
MPELPEVQTVVSDLNKKIKDYRIVGFWSDWPKAIKNLSLKRFTKDISGRKIIAARRIGKNIFIDLSGGKTLYLHLKMTGHLLIKSQAESCKTEGYFADRVNQYIRHSWKLKDEKGKIVDLDFSDVRKFAKIVLVDTDKVAELKEIKALGIDAMDPKFTLKKFQAILTKREHRPIGTILMEQDLIAGIGNIYRSEILFAAGVDPQKKAVKLTQAEIKKLFEVIRKILKKAIEMRGTSDSDYRDTSGAPGGFQKVLRVYRRAGQKCFQCATILERKKIGQRSVFFCPSCQK